MMTPPSRSHSGKKDSDMDQGLRSYWVARRQAMIIELNALSKMLGLPPVSTRRMGVRERENQ